MKRTGIRTILIAVGILVISGIWTVSPFGRIRSVHEYLIGKYYRFEPVSDEELLQYFTPQYNYLDSIELFLANISADMNGKICIELFDSSGKKIFIRKYSAGSIPTGEFKEYKVGKKVTPGKAYILQVSYDGTEVEKPQIMISERKKNLLETGEMYVGEELSEFNMAITYHYSQRKWFGEVY